jgi:hypothetical protein
MRVTTIILVVCLVGCTSVPPPRNAAPSAESRSNAVPAIHRPHRPPPRVPAAIVATPQLVGAGMGVLLNVVGSDLIVAFAASDGTHVLDVSTGNVNIFTGTLDDLQNGVALTEIASDTVPDELFLNGSLAAKAIFIHPAVIAGSDVAWVSGGNSVYLSGSPLPSPSGDIVELTASGNFIAWALETGPVDCAVYVNSVFVSSVPGCPYHLKVTAANGIVYVGWADGGAAYVAQSTDSGATWTIDTVFSGGQGVYATDYAVRADGSLVVVWIEYLASEDGSSVWESDAGGLPVRLSGPVVAGLAGAGNPVVASDGSVAWLDDTHANALGSYDIFLNGADLSTVDGATQGPILRLKPDGTRVVAWDDGTSVWVEQIP